MNNYIKDMILKLPNFNTIKSIKCNTNYYIIYVLLIDICNYNCSYCCNKFPRTNKQIDIYDLYNYIQNISKKIYQPIQLIVLGGEPTLHNLLFELCKLCNGKNIEILIHTNFSQNYTYYLKFLLSFHNVKFVFSCHSEKHQNLIFYYNSMLLYKNLDSTIFNEQSFIIMYEHKNIDASISIYNILTKFIKNIEIGLIDVTIRYKHLNRYAYNDKQINAIVLLTQNKLLAKNIELVFTNDKYIVNDFLYSCLVYYKYILDLKVRSCNAGKTSIFIDQNGDIYPCIDQYINNEKAILNIKSNKFFETNKILFCNKCLNCGSLTIDKDFKFGYLYSINNKLFYF